MSDLEVIGGAGGTEVAVEGLRRAAAGLRRCAELVETGLGADWEVAPWLVVRAPPSTAVQVARAWAESGELRRRVAAAVVRLRDLADSTVRAADSYESAEARTRALVGAVHDHAMAVALVVTASTGRAFGLLETGFDPSTNSPLTSPRPAACNSSYADRPGPGRSASSTPQTAATACRSLGSAILR